MSNRAARKRTRATGKVVIDSFIEENGSKKKVRTITQSSKVLVADVDHPNPGMVQVAGGVTKNLGDFNSFKMSVSVSLPCFPSIEGARAKYEEVSELVDELMEKENKKL
jgi:predicted RNA-binding protein